MPSQEELEKQGWAPASVTGGEHLRRVLEMYQELGDKPGRVQRVHGVLQVGGRDHLPRLYQAQG